MERFTYPIFIDCIPPLKAIKIADDTYKLPIDFKEALHHAYVDTHGLPPKRGTNPLFDEYEQLLDNSDELRFKNPGIADDTESRVRESGKLGRGIARYILSEYYGYVWFDKIQNLIGKPKDGWEVLRSKSGGVTPDWLITDGKYKYCIGEAKGTHSYINIKSATVAKWRRQCTNIILKKDGRTKALKSWLIATRFVNKNSLAIPEQLIEDPDSSGEKIGDNEFNSLNKYLVQENLYQSLFRVSKPKIANKIQENISVGNNQYVAFRPKIRELSHLTFIGNAIGKIPLRDTHPFFRDVTYDSNISGFWGFGCRLLEEKYMDSMFDGIAIDSITQFYQNNFNGIEVNNETLDKYPYISLLKDGNIIIPMSQMRPDRLVSF